MNFKDCLQNDIDNTFFNTNEFAEVHTYNGKKVKAIVDDDKLLEMKLRVNQHSDGLSSSQKVMIVKKTDMDSEPFADQYVILDGEQLCITNVQNSDGVYTITMGGIES